MDTYNNYLKYGPDSIRGNHPSETMGDGQVRSGGDNSHWSNHVIRHHTADEKPHMAGYNPGRNALFPQNRDGDVNLNKMGVFKREDFLSMRSVLNDPEMEKIYERAMNANNEKSRHLYLHALGDRVESQVQNTILANKGLRNSLFQGVKLDRNAFLQSNGKYISFTKNYKFRPGGSVAEAEKSWAGKLLSGLGFKLDTVGSGNLIDKIGGLLAGKLLDGTDDLYNAPEMPMRFNLHYRGAGNQNYLPYDYENGRYAPKHTGAWWQEDINIASKQEYKPQR